MQTYGTFGPGREKSSIIVTFFLQKYGAGVHLIFSPNYYKYMIIMYSHKEYPFAFVTVPVS